jgi:hypothetical protein
MDLPDVGSGREDDALVTLVEIDVAEAAAPAVVDLIVLFVRMVEERLLSPADVMVGPRADGRVRLVAPDYLAGSVEEVERFATWAGPLPLRPEQVTSELLDLAGLISSMWSEAGPLELPALEQLLAAIGLLITRDGRV